MHRKKHSNSSSSKSRRIDWLTDTGKWSLQAWKKEKTEIRPSGSGAQVRDLFWQQHWYSVSVRVRPPTTTITNSSIVFYQAKKVSLAAIFLSCLFSENVKDLPPLQRVIKFPSSSVKSSSFLLSFSFSSSSSSFQDGLPNTIDTGKGRRKKKRKKARERDESPCLASPNMRKPQMNRIGSLNGLTGWLSQAEWTVTGAAGGGSTAGNRRLSLFSPFHCRSRRCGQLTLTHILTKPTKLPITGGGSDSGNGDDYATVDSKIDWALEFKIFYFIFSNLYFFFLPLFWKARQITNRVGQNLCFYYFYFPVFLDKESLPILFCVCAQCGLGDSEKKRRREGKRSQTKKPFNWAVKRFEPISAQFDDMFEQKLIQRQIKKLCKLKNKKKCIKSDRPLIWHYQNDQKLQT